MERTLVHVLIRAADSPGLWEAIVLEWDKLLLRQFPVPDCPQWLHDDKEQLREMVSDMVKADGCEPAFLEFIPEDLLLDLESVKAHIWWMAHSHRFPQEKKVWLLQELKRYVVSR